MATLSSAPENNMIRVPTEEGSRSRSSINRPSGMTLNRAMRIFTVALALWMGNAKNARADDILNPGESVTKHSTGIDMDGDKSSNTFDCNDTDPSVYPGATENCTNGKDDDCDGFKDAQDPACKQATVSPTPSPTAEPTDQTVSPTAEPTTVTQEPTATATANPTDESPTADPTASPTSTGSPKPTPQPSQSDSPTVEPTKESTGSPKEGGAKGGCGGCAEMPDTTTTRAKIWYALMALGAPIALILKRRQDDNLVPDMPNFASTQNKEDFRYTVPW